MRNDFINEMTRVAEASGDSLLIEASLSFRELIISCNELSHAMTGLSHDSEQYRLLGRLICVVEQTYRVVLERMKLAVGDDFPPPPNLRLVWRGSETEH